MNREYTAIIKQSGECWTGWIEEVPGINCQEKTHDELLESLSITLKEALEFNRRDAISGVGAGYIEEKITV
jgi:predicted RNase H-like HicB family nuclease